MVLHFRGSIVPMNWKQSHRINNIGLSFEWWQSKIFWVEVQKGVYDLGGLNAILWGDIFVWNHDTLHSSIKCSLNTIRCILKYQTRWWIGWWLKQTIGENKKILGTKFFTSACIVHTLLKVRKCQAPVFHFSNLSDFLLPHGQKGQKLHDGFWFFLPMLLLMNL